MADAAPPVGRNRYRLLEVLGHRRLTTVYRGFDTALHVERAVKVLLPAYAAFPDRLERFRREAQAMARLQHPHVVSVHDVGVELGRAFIVMELMDGGTLEDRVKREGALSPGAAVEVAIQIADALQAAHEADVVHRDLRPQNVFFTPRGACKVCEFGLARMIKLPEGSKVITQAGMSIGLLPFASPEQIRDARSVDARADVYAAGATLHYMLTAGRLPRGLHFEEEDVDGLLPALAEIILRATRIQPSERYQRVDELGDVLRAVVA